MIRQSFSLLTARCVLFLGLTFAIPCTALCQTLLEPHESMPRFELSNARFETDRQGEALLVIDFRRRGALAPKIAIDIAARISDSSAIEKVTANQPFIEKLSSEDQKFAHELGTKE